MDKEFQRKIKKYVAHRSWQNLLSGWLTSLPELESPGLAPEYGLDDYYPLQSFLGSCSSDETFLKEVEGLRALIFHEGLFLLHKSSHVIGAAEHHADKGILTWSLSSAYQGALFGAMAIMRFLGVATVVENKNHWLVDLYPEPPKLPSRDRKLKVRLSPMTLFLRLGSRVEHRHLWRIFQRLMRVSRFEEQDIINKVAGAFSKSNFDVRDFARQRNALHYEARAWFFQDMHTFTLNPTFGLREALSDSDLQFNHLESDFTMLLAMAILYVGISLLDSIASKSRKIEGDLNLVHQSISKERHPMFFRNRFT